MKNYYKKIIDSNQLLLLDIHKKMLDYDLIDVRQLRQKQRTFDINNNISMNIYSSSHQIVVDLYLSLENIKVKIEWDISEKKDKEKLVNFEMFKKPDFIEITKIKKNNLIETSFRFHSNKNIGLEILSIGKTINKNENYQNAYRLYIDNTIRLCSTSDNYKQRDPNIESQYSFARTFIHSNILESNIKEFHKYLFENKDLSKNLKDLLLLESDVKNDDIEMFRNLLPKISDFNVKMECIYGVNIKKNRLNK